MNREKFTLPGQAEEMAIRGAVVVAQRNLLEIIDGVQVYGQTVVKDLETQSDIIVTRIQGIIKGAMPVDTVVTKDYAQVTLRINR